MKEVLLVFVFEVGMGGMKMKQKVLYIDWCLCLIFFRHANIGSKMRLMATINHVQHLGDSREQHRVC